MFYIYCYTNKINGHQYVGQTNNLSRRIREHRSNSNNRNSPEYNVLFHRKLREYGEENFDLDILEKSEEDNVNEREMYWINKLQTYAGFGKGGYNMTLGGDNKEHSRLYSLEQISQIKQLIKDGCSYPNIQKQIPISMGYISGINTGLYFFDENENYPLRRFYTEESVILSIKKELRTTATTMVEIAKKYNMAYSTIKKINYGNLHREDCEYPLRKNNSSLQKAIIIKEMLSQGCSNAEIIGKTGVSANTIRRINKGETYFDSAINYPIR